MLEAQNKIFGIFNLEKLLVYLNKKENININDNSLNLSERISNLNLK